MAHGDFNPEQQKLVAQALYQRRFNSILNELLQKQGWRISNDKAYAPSGMGHLAQQESYDVAYATAKVKARFAVVSHGRDGDAQPAVA